MCGNTWKCENTDKQFSQKTTDVLSVLDVFIFESVPRDLHLRSFVYTYSLK